MSSIKKEQDSIVKVKSESSSRGPDDNTMRILVSSDNHLGYMEKDPLRGEDSFKAFEEVFFCQYLF